MVDQQTPLETEIRRLIDAAIIGTGPLTKAGAGVLELSSASNTYSGGTIVSAPPSELKNGPK